MKTIIRIIARLNIGGPAIHIANLCGLDKRGYRTVLIYGSTGDGEGDMSYLLEGKNVEAFHVPELGREISPLRDLAALWKIIRIMWRVHPDIVHTHTAKAGMVGRLAAKLAGVKQVYHTFHGHVFHGYFSPAKTKLFIAIERFLARFTTRIIVLSQRQRNEIQRVLCLPEDKLIITPLGFDLERLLRIESRVVNRHASEPTAIGVVGRLTGIKNHGMFVDSLARINRKGTAFRGFIIGDGELRQELGRRVHEQGLEERVEFTGWKKDLAPVYENLDYLFLTSLNEGTPVAVIEAMAGGVLVIATDVGGVGDIVSDGESGFLVPSNDPEKLAERFAEVHSLPVERKKMIIENARECAMAFSKKKLLENIDRLYRSE